MAEFEHKGIKITLGGNGKFTATVGGAFVAKNSLPAMEKYIDKQIESAFEPFEAWTRKSYSTELYKVKIVSFQPKRKGSRWDEDQFRSEDGGGHQPRKLILDTPENLAAYAALISFDEETKRIEEERKVKRDALHEAVKHPKVPGSDDD
jgi:hypothetical protein